MGFRAIIRARRWQRQVQIVPALTSEEILFEYEGRAPPPRLCQPPRALALVLVQALPQEVVARLLSALSLPSQAARLLPGSALALLLSGLALAQLRPALGLVPPVLASLLI